MILYWIVLNFHADSGSSPAYQLNFRHSSALSLSDYTPPATPTRQRGQNTPLASRTLTAGPSQLETTGRSTMNRKLLQKLVDGNGLSDFEVAGLFERCDGCGLTFEGVTLRQHIKQLCRGEIAQ